MIKSIARIELTDEQVRCLKKYEQSCIRQDKPNALIAHVIWLNGGGAILGVGMMSHDISLKFQELIGVTPDKRMEDSEGDDA